MVVSNNYYVFMVKAVIYMPSDNLVPFDKLTVEKQRELASKGGRASVESRRRKKSLKQELLLLLEQGDTQNKVSLALVQKAMNGDTKAFEVLRDTIGEKPTDKQVISMENSPVDKLVQSIEGIKDADNK